MIQTQRQPQGLAQGLARGIAPQPAGFSFVILLATAAFLLLLVAVGLWAWDISWPAGRDRTLEVRGHASVPTEVQAAPQIELSPEERAYLDSLGPLTVAPDPDWVPYEHVDAYGNFTGIAADLLELLQQRLGLRFTYVFPGDWDYILQESKAGNILILPFLNQTPAREEWLVFTEPLLVDPSVFITREEHAFILDATQLSGYSIVFPIGTSLEERVRRDFPNLQVVHVANENEVFRAIAERTADMTLRPLTVAAYTIRKDGLFVLKVAGQAPENYINRLRMGVLKEHVLLRDILNRGIATISERERNEIVNRHVNITVVQPVDYGLLLRLAGAALVLLALAYYWNYRLSRLNAALSESERSKSVLLANLPGMAYRCRFDADWTMEFVSEGSEALTGYRADELVQNRQKAFAAIIHPEDRAKVVAEWDDAIESKHPARIEYRILARNGTTRWVLEQGVLVSEPTGGPPIIEGLIIDISERKRAEMALYEVSIHDQLTGMHNRRYVYQRLEQMVVQAQREGLGFCVAILDLDHFKQVNDSYGHLAGDAVLQQFAQLLLASVRAYDLVGRYGGEEFILVASEVELPMVKRMLDRLLVLLRKKQFGEDGRQFVVTFSAGVANTRELGTPLALEPLLARADARLYAAKHAGRNRVHIEG